MTMPACLKKYTEYLMREAALAAWMSHVMHVISARQRFDGREIQKNSKQSSRSVVTKNIVKVLLLI
jgi:hypothetical protein